MKRKKRHSGDKRAQAFFQNSVVWSWESDIAENGLQAVYAKSFVWGRGWVEHHEQRSKALVHYVNQWIFASRIMLNFGEGQTKIDVEAMIIDQQLPLTQFFDGLYKSQIARLTRTRQARHIVDKGWIAFTYKGDKANAEKRLAGSFEEQELGEGAFTKERQDRLITIELKKELAA